MPTGDDTVEIGKKFKYGARSRTVDALVCGHNRVWQVGCRLISANGAVSQGGDKVNLVDLLSDIRTSSDLQNEVFLISLQAPEY